MANGSLKLMYAKSWKL